MTIELKNVSKSFGENVVISGFSRIFSSGSTTVIMGQSGCGKSTLLNLMMGFLTPDSGEVIIPKDCKKSAVFQENRLCENLTAAANIRLAAGKKLSQSEIDEAFSAVKLTDIEKKPARMLSGGMKRRVALVRALLSPYDVLFLDEPFKGLDSETKYAVMEYVKQKTAGRTVIMVTHDREECELLADDTIML